MKLGIVVHSSEAETVWNAFRFGVFAAKQGDAVRVFLIGQGVDAEARSTERFPVPDQMRALLAAGGRIDACGTCMKIRHSQGSELCPLSTLQDLYDLVRDSDRVISF